VLGSLTDETDFDSASVVPTKHSLYDCKNGNCRRTTGVIKAGANKETFVGTSNPTSEEGNINCGVVTNRIEFKGSAAPFDDNNYSVPVKCKSGTYDVRDRFFTDCKWFINEI